MSLGQIISGALLASKLAFTSADSAALEQKYVEVRDDTAKIEMVSTPKESEYLNVSNPFNIKMETGGSSAAAHPVKFQRIQLGNSNFEAKYDFNGSGEDVARLLVMLPSDFGVAAYKVGDWNESDNFYLEAFKTINLNQGKSLFLDGGMGFGKDMIPAYFALAKFTNDKLFAEIAIFEDAKNIDDLNKSIFVCAGYDFGHAYVGAGKNRNTLVGVVGVNDYKDIGMITFGLYDVETKGWSFISQTAVGDVNSNFFTKENFDFITEYFSVPAFFPVHFTPQVTKGDYSLKVKGSGTAAKTTLEATVGLGVDNFGVSAGVSAVNKDGSTEMGAVVELYKPFKLFGADCYGELKYDSGTGLVLFYIGANFNQK